MKRNFTHWTIKSVEVQLAQPFKKKNVKEVIRGFPDLVISKCHQHVDQLTHHQSLHQGKVTRRSTFGPRLCLCLLQCPRELHVIGTCQQIKKKNSQLDNVKKKKKNTKKNKTTKEW